MQYLTLAFGVFAGIALSQPITSDVHTPLNATILQAREILAGTHSSLSIWTYSEPNCKGLPVAFDASVYSVNQGAAISSYKLFRDLETSEQLDFSFDQCNDDPGATFNICIPCGQYYSSAWEGAPGGVCYDLGKKADCFRLWHH